jgi:hypothetical protein
LHTVGSFLFFMTCRVAGFHQISNHFFFNSCGMAVITAILTLSCGLQAAAQGTFQNLNFESASVSGYSPGTFGIPITSAFPGWQASSGSNPASQGWYDGISLGSPMFSITDAKTGISSFGPLDGDYSALLFAAGNNSVSLSQTGQVPVGTESIQMEAREQFSSFVVTLGGDTISMVPLQTFANYTLYGGNIPSPLVGQVEGLSIAELPPPSTAPSEDSPSSLLFDDVAFSPQSVPEPNTIEMVIMGGTMLGLHGWRKRGAV